MNVYFIPGMCLNGKVFDNIRLPYGYEKKYIEWHVPGNEEVEQCVTCTFPKYIKWAADQITKWTPTVHCENLYHIHGTNDQTFPFKLIKEAIAIEKGDHLMPLKKAEEVSKTIAEIIFKIAP